MTGPTAAVDARTRKRAMIVLGASLLVATITWVLLGRASESGLDRLARLDRARAHCDSLFATARSQTESLRVARTPLRDTIDPRSRDAIRECGDVR